MKVWEPRFWAKVDKSGECWEWTAGLRDGYGSFKEGTKGRTHSSHRLSYELTVGPIPQGMLIDHRCRNKRCVRPEHLRPVTRKQNGEHRAGPGRNSKTGILGVHQLKNGFYVATVGHNGKHAHGGRFTTLEEAAVAVKALRLQLFTHNDVDRKTA